MATGTSLLLIAVGAILRYAVTADVSGIDLRVVGLVLMVVGIVGMILSLVELAILAPRRRSRLTAVPLADDEYDSPGAELRQPPVQPYRGAGRR